MKLAIFINQSFELRPKNWLHAKIFFQGGKQKLSKKLSMSTAAANMGVTLENFIKMKSVTGLTTEEIIQSHKGFLKK